MALHFPEIGLGSTWEARSVEKWLRRRRLWAVKGPDNSVKIAAISTDPAAAGRTALVPLKP